MEVRKLKWSHIHWLQFREEMICSLKTKSELYPLQLILDTTSKWDFFCFTLKKCLNHFYCTKPKLLQKISVIKQTLLEFHIKFQRSRKQFCQLPSQRSCLVASLAVPNWVSTSIPLRTCT